MARAHPPPLHFLSFPELLLDNLLFFNKKMELSGVCFHHGPFCACEDIHIAGVRIRWKSKLLSEVEAENANVIFKCLWDCQHMALYPGSDPQSERILDTVFGGFAGNGEYRPLGKGMG